MASNASMNRSCAVRVMPRRAFSRSRIDEERSSCWVRRNPRRSSSSRYSSSAMRLTGSSALIRCVTVSSRARASSMSRSGSWARRSASASTSNRRRASASRSCRRTRSSARRMACSWTARLARLRSDSDARSSSEACVTASTRSRMASAATRVTASISSRSARTASARASSLRRSAEPSSRRARRVSSRSSPLRIRSCASASSLWFRTRSDSIVSMRPASAASSTWASRKACERRPSSCESTSIRPRSSVISDATRAAVASTSASIWRWVRAFRLDGGGVPAELGDLGADRLQHQPHALALAHDLLEVLGRAQPIRLRGLPGGGARALGVVERGDALLGPAPALLSLLDLRLETQDLGPEVADRALPREERGIAAARGPPAAERAGRAQHLAAHGHEARVVTVLGVQPLRRAQVAHDDDGAEEVRDQARMARRDERLRQTHDARIGADVGLRRAVEPVERQKRRLPAPVAAEIPERRLGGLEGFHHDPLELLAQRRLDRALELARHVEEVGDRAHDAAKARLSGRGEDGLHALGVARALGLELLQRGAARPAGRERHARGLRRPPSPRCARPPPRRRRWPGRAARPRGWPRARRRRRRGRWRSRAPPRCGRARRRPRPAPP